MDLTQDTQDITIVFLFNNAWAVNRQSLQLYLSILYLSCLFLIQNQEINCLKITTEI